MADRVPYIAANWKMNKTVAEAAEFVDALLPRIAATQSDVVVCPPFTALTAVVERRYGTAVKVAAQNMHEEESGAFTGEVSAAMLVELDVEAVVLGHSERRQYFNETDRAMLEAVVYDFQNLLALRSRDLVAIAQPLSATSVTGL